MAKEIKIDNDKIEKEKDQHGNVKLKHDGNDVTSNAKEVTLGDLIGLLNDPEAQIITRKNPTCYWYWDGRQWKKYCW